MSAEASFPRSGPSDYKKRQESKRDQDNHDKDGANEKRAAKLETLSKLKNDNLFKTRIVVEEEEQPVKKEKRTKKKKSSKKDEESDEETIAMTNAEAATLKGIAVPPPNHLHPLNIHNIEKGMGMIGAVREVHDLHAIIALPNGVKGKLIITEYSDSLTETVKKEMENVDGDDMDVDDDATADRPVSGFPTSLTQLLKVGQLLRVAALNNMENSSEERTIDVTTRESRLNGSKDPATRTTVGAVLAVSIKSIEDHGYTVSTGLGNSGFLPFPSKRTPWKLGERIDATIASFKSGVYTFTYDAATINTPVSSTHVVGVDSLHPGMLVEATIFKVLNLGLWLNFLDYFSGSVDIHHVAYQGEANGNDIPVIFNSEEQLERYFEQDSKVVARIIHIHPETKRVALSLLPHLVSWTPFKFDIAIGTRIEDGIIKRVDEKAGIAFEVKYDPAAPATSNSDAKHDDTHEGSDDEADKKKNKKKDMKADKKSKSQEKSESDKMDTDNNTAVVYRAYAPLSRVSDKEKKYLSADHYVVDTPKKVRVFALNILEGELMVSHRKSDWKDPYMSFADVNVGDTVEGKVKSFHKNGLLISLSTRVSGFVAKGHLSDIAISDPESRFPIGSTVKARVLSVSVEDEKMQLTLKKTMLKSTLDIFKDYKSLAPNAWSHGTLEAIYPRGLLVVFYNHVKGFVPLHEISSLTFEKDESEKKVLKKLNDTFLLGQVLKCRVVEVNPGAERLQLSLSSTISTSQLARQGIADYIERFPLCTFLKDVEVDNAEEQGLYLSYEDKKEGLKVPVFIPLHHLSDYKSLAKARLESIKVGSKLSLFIIARRRNSLVATLKPSLLKAHDAKQLPTSIDQVKVGDVRQGYVSKLLNSSILISFGGDFKCIAHRNNLATKQVTSIESDFYLNQSVTAEVTLIDEGKLQATLSLNSSAATAARLPSSDEFISAYLSEASLTAQPKRGIDWSKIAIGSVIQTKITAVESWGITASFSMGKEQVKCFIHPEQVDSSSADYEVGESYDAVVLDVDQTKNIADLSLRSDLVAKFSSTGKKQKISSKKAYQATVQLVKTDYMALALSDNDLPATLVFVATHVFNNEVYAEPHKQFKLFSELEVTVSEASVAQKRIGFVAPHSAGVFTTASNTSKLQYRNSALKSLADVKIGATVEGMVTGVQAGRIDISLGYHIRGTLDISGVVDIKLPSKSTMEKLLSPSSDKSKKNLAKELKELELPSEHPFAAFKLGQMVSNLKVHSFIEQNPDGVFNYDLQTLPQSTLGAGSRVFVALTLAKHVRATESYAVGQIVPFYISQITATELSGKLNHAVRGVVSNVAASHDSRVASNLAAHFKAGQVVLAAIEHFDATKNKARLSIRALHIEAGVATSAANAKVGDSTIVKILGFRFPNLRIEVFDQVLGEVFVTELSDTFDANPLQTYSAKEGQLVDARILESLEYEGKQRFIVSLRPSVVKPSSSKKSASKNDTKIANPRISDFDELSVGMKVSGYITKHFPQKHFCFVSLSAYVSIHLPYGVLGEKYVSDPVKSYPVGTLVTGTIVGLNLEKKRADFAMREKGSRPDLLKYEDFKVGQIVDGVVSGITPLGVFIMINSSKISALCHVNKLVDRPHEKRDEDAPQNGKKDSKKEEPPTMTLDEIKANFKVGDKVSAVVAFKNEEKKRLALSMRPSDLLLAKKNKKRAAVQEEDKPADNVDESDDSSVASQSGSASEEESDEILSSALQKRGSKKRAALDLPQSASDDEESVSGSSDMDVDQKPAAKTSKKVKFQDTADSDEEHVSLHPDRDSESSGSEAGDHEGSDSEQSGSGDEDDSEASGSEANNGSGDASGEEDEEEQEQVAGLTSGVEWSDLKFSNGKKQTKKESSSAMDVDQPIKAAAKTERKSKKNMTTEDEIQEEMEVMAKEKALLGENKLERDADFERALIATPNSSYVWTRWIAQRVADGEIHKARELAEKALKRIDDKEEEERFNVWVFFLNLENQYGTRESFQILLKRAAASHKPKPIYAEAIKMLLKTGHKKEGEAIYEQLLKKYKHCMSSWVNWATYHFETKQFDKARDILNRSLKSLVPRKHIPLLEKFAMLEFRLGDAERGRTIFENLITSHPKRTDLWGVYVDMELKYAKDFERCRQLFERMISLPLNPTKMKPIFKRYLTFESTHGTSDTITHVKTKASEYIEKAAKQ